MSKGRLSWGTITEAPPTGKIALLDFHRSEALKLPRKPPRTGFVGLLKKLDTGLKAENVAAVRKATSDVVARLARAYRSPIPLLVIPPGVRPFKTSEGTLSQVKFADYTPRQGSRIRLWMYTSKKRKSVAFRSFLFTLIHEFSHHLDHTLFSAARRAEGPDSLRVEANPNGLLRGSPHTRGFYDRCWDIFYAILGEPRKRFIWRSLGDGRYIAREP